MRLPQPTDVGAKAQGGRSQRGRQAVGTDGAGAAETKGCPVICWQDLRPILCLGEKRESVLLSPGCGETLPITRSPAGEVGKGGLVQNRKGLFLLTRFPGVPMVPGALSTPMGKSTFTGSTGARVAPTTPQAGAREGGEGLEHRNFNKDVISLLLNSIINLG